MVKWRRSVRRKVRGVARGGAGEVGGCSGWSGAEEGCGRGW